MQIPPSSPSSYVMACLPFSDSSVRALICLHPLHLLRAIRSGHASQLPPLHAGTHHTRDVGLPVSASSSIRRPDIPSHRLLSNRWVFAIVGIAVSPQLLLKIYTLGLTVFSCQGSRLVLNLRAKHADNISNPSSPADLSFTLPSHIYSSVSAVDDSCLDIDDTASMSTSASHYHERSALSPSARSNTASSAGTGSRHLRAQTPPSPERMVLVTR